MAVGTLWVCRRDIINLKTRRRFAAPQFKQRRVALTSRFEPHGRTRPAGWIHLRHVVSLYGRSPEHRMWQAVRRVDNPPGPFSRRPQAIA
jgi:hypothetical protein